MEQMESKLDYQLLLKYLNSTASEDFSLSPQSLQVIILLLSKAYGKKATKSALMDTFISSSKISGGRKKTGESHYSMSGKKHDTEPRGSTTRRKTSTHKKKAMSAY